MDYKCNNYKPKKEYRRKKVFLKARCRNCKNYAPSIEFKNTNYCVAKELI